jgi:hypothetical protein
MANTLKLWINAETGRLLASASASASAPGQVFYAGNEVDLELHLVAGVGVARVPYEIPFPAGAAIEVAVGTVATAPLAGQWRLSVDSTETSDLAFNAAASAVQTALNAISAVSTDGGVTVSALGGGYSITWNTVGTKPSILAGSDTLTPSSYESILVLQAGDVSTREIVFVELRQAPLALADTFTAIGTPVVSTTTVSAWNGSNKVVRVSIEPDPKSGSYSLTIGAKSATIPAVASTNDFNTALLVSGITNVSSVSQTGSFQYDLVLTEDVAVSSNGSGLIASSGLTGPISLATSELIAYLGSEASKTASLEITSTAAGQTRTLCQVACTVANGVIASGAVSPITIGTLLTESVANARFIRKDLVDAPSTATQDILWQNLGVTTDGSDTVAAINASVSPASGNPFLTVSDGDTRYAAVGSNPFDQDLNTTDSPTFTGIIINDGDTGSYGATSAFIGQIAINGAAGGIDLGSGTGLSITFEDATVQNTAFIPADYLTVTTAASTYLTITTAASTYALQSSFDQSLKTTDSPSFVSITAPVSSGGASPVTLDSGGIHYADSTVQTTAFINDGTANWSAASIDFIDIFSGTLNIASATGITFADTTVQNTRVVREQQANASGYTNAGFYTHYPDEIKVIDDTGTAYWVPARLV